MIQTPPLLEATNIHKSFNGNSKTQVLSGLDITIQPGEMISIIGESGTGKTTLLNILGTLERPNSGTMVFNGRNIFIENDVSLAKFRNKSIGFVFQFHHLLPEFTAIENIIIPGLIAGIQRDELLSNAKDLLGKINLQNRETYKVGELSGGEQQRIALARALIMKPDILLADEPTGNLDPHTGQIVFDLLKSLNDSNSMATVIVTHNLNLAKKMDRCLSLSDGKLKQI